MNIPDLITLLKKRLVNLSSLRSSADALGDLAQIERIDSDIAETQATLNQLQTLNG